MSTGWLGVTAEDSENPLRAVLADANELHGHGTALTGVVREIEKSLTGMRWDGDDRAAFEQVWAHEVKPELERTATAMLTDATELTSLAAAQARASAEA